MKKTIEEITKIIMGAIPETNNILAPASEEEARMEAEALYNAGYRKTFTSEFASEALKAFKEGYAKGRDEQKEEIERYKCVNKLLEQDIEDLHKEREKRVEEVYADFMKDYNIMRDELNECYDENGQLQDELRQYAKMFDDGIVVTKEWHEKQVAILTEERENMQAEIIAMDEARLQAVKDTAKEIYDLAEKHNNGYENDMCRFQLELAERYGVEVKL